MSPLISGRRPLGGALALVLALAAGLLLGLAASLGPRFAAIDIWKTVKPLPPEIVEVALPSDDLPPGAAVHPREVELRRLIADVSKQRAALEAQNRPLAAREAQIEERRKALEALKQQIDDAEKRIRTVIVEMDASEVKNTKKMAKMWAQMEPLDVVRVIKGMDLQAAAKVVSTMNDRQAAAVLGALTSSPETEKLTTDLVVKLKQIKPAAEPAPAQPQ